MSLSITTQPIAFLDRFYRRGSPDTDMDDGYDMRGGIRLAFLRRTDSPWVVLGIVSIVYLLFIIARLGAHGYDASYFVTAGDKFCDPHLVPKSLGVINKSSGYDGQFYYRLALNPFTSTRTEFGVTFDHPPHRQQRIVYPFLVWVLSMGRADRAPILLIVVNYLVLCLMGWIGGAYAQSMRQHALWGIVLPLYPGFLLTLSRDLTEIVEVGLLLAGLLLIRRGNHLLATFLLTLAALTKETSLLVPAGAMLACLAGVWQSKAGKALPWRLFLFPLITYGAWQVFLFYRWEQLSLSGRMHTLGLPLLGFIRFFLSTAALTTASQRLWFVELWFIVAFAVSVVCALGSTVAWKHEKLSWSLYVILVALLTRVVWVEDWAFLRALPEFYVLGAIIVIGSRVKMKAALFACSTALWLFLFCNLIKMG
jgi:hypothetical protein